MQSTWLMVDSMVTELDDNGAIRSYLQWSILLPIVTNRCISRISQPSLPVAAKSLINSGSSGKKGHLYTDLKTQRLKTQRFLYTDDFSIDFFDYRRVRPANWAPPLHVTRNVKQRHRLSTGATTTARSWCDCGNPLLVDRLQLRY